MIVVREREGKNSRVCARFVVVWCIQVLFRNLNICVSLLLS